MEYEFKFEPGLLLIYTHADMQLALCNSLFQWSKLTKHEYFNRKLGGFKMKPAVSKIQNNPKPYKQAQIMRCHL